MLTYFQFSPYFLLSLGLSILGQLLKKVKIKMLYRTLNMKHNFIFILLEKYNNKAFYPDRAEYVMKRILNAFLGVHFN